MLGLYLVPVVIQFGEHAISDVRAVRASSAEEAEASVVEYYSAFSDEWNWDGDVLNLFGGTMGVRTQGALLFSESQAIEILSLRAGGKVRITCAHCGADITAPNSVELISVHVGVGADVNQKGHFVIGQGGKPEFVSTSTTLRGAPLWISNKPRCIACLADIP